VRLQMSTRKECSYQATVQSLTAGSLKSNSAAERGSRRADRKDKGFLQPLIFVLEDQT